MKWRLNFDGKVEIISLTPRIHYGYRGCVFAMFSESNARVFSLSSLVLLTILNVGLVLQADPGKAFQEIRAKLVAKHDQNGDGRLDESEREMMRVAAKQNFGRGRNERRGRGGFQGPPEWIERYDSDGDGELSRQEQGAAFMGEQARMTKKYDADGNGSLDDSEKKTLKKDFEGGAFNGVDRFIAMQVGGFEREQRRGRRGGGGGFSETQRLWMKFDADGDGKASPSELEMIRGAIN